jgi:hypothetical protein
VVGAVVAALVVIGIIAAVLRGPGAGTGTSSSPALVTNSTQSTGTATQAETARKTEPPPPQTFKGSGSENLGTISVAVPSTLEWRCPSCNLFSANAISTSGTETITVDAPGRTSGVTAVEPGTYHSVEVIANETEADTGWMIVLTAGQ